LEAAAAVEIETLEILVAWLKVMSLESTRDIWDRDTMPCKVLVLEKADWEEYGNAKAIGWSIIWERPVLLGG
jgi:hypothetical protein